MESVETKKDLACPLPEISAYIDGELAASEELRLEMHIAGCRVCADDLNLQKSFLNALDFSLEADEKIELPDNFTKTVVASAESHVSGLRRPHERRNAAFICSGLIVFALFALASSRENSLSAATGVLERSLAVISSVGHLVFDLALGSAIVFRSLAAKFVFESGIAVLFFSALFVASLYLFSRLLIRFHRT